METNEIKKSSASSFAIIEKLIIDGEAPPHIKIAAAKGALPLDPLSLLRLRILLMNDRDKTVQSEAAKGIRSIPEEDLLHMLKDGKCHPLVLSFFATVKGKDNQFLEAIVQNPSASTVLLSQMAQSAPAEVLDLLIMNEQRLISSPSIMEAMEKNPNLKEHMKSKIIELREKFLSEERITKEKDHSIGGREKEEEKKEGDMEEEALPPIDIDDISMEEGKTSAIDIDEALSESYILDGDELYEAPQEIRDTYRKILALSIPEKIMRALKGNRTERSILIRDSNRLVSITVLKNAKLSEPEVESFAAMKSLDEEVLREIGKTREWTKHYPVCLNLVKNPKTPPAISTSLIHRMTNNDLKHIQIDKNVPELIRGMARKTLRIRTQKSISVRKK